MSKRSGPGPDVSVIIVSYNTAAVLPEVMAALQRAAGNLAIQTIIVDNASRDDSVEMIRRRFPECELIVNQTNVGFGRANNQALGLVQAPYVLLLNPDALVAPDTLDKTVAYMDTRERCGILGVNLVDRDGVRQPSARYFPTPWNLFLARTGLYRRLKHVFGNVRMVDDMEWDHASVRECDWLPGCYYLIRKEVIDQVGLFDPRYFLYYEEVDQCLAAKKAGWEVVFYPYTTVVHFGGESAKSEGDVTQRGSQIEALQVESELLYLRKNHGAAAVWLRVFLAVLGDAFLTVKHLLKRKPLAECGAYMRHLGLMLSLFRRTHLGTRPTR